MEVLCYPCQRPADGVAIKTLQPDHHEMLGLLHVGTRECEVNAAAYPLHHDRRRLVGDAGMALDAQHAGEIQGVADARAHGIDAGSRGRHHDDAVEIVMVVLFFLAVMTGSRRHVVFRGGIQADQHRRRQVALGTHDVDAGPQHGFETRLDPGQRRRRNQIALREHHQIGAGELVLEYFLDRIVVIQ